MSTPLTKRLSVPPRKTTPPRPLTYAEQATLLRIADALIPASGPNPSASSAKHFVQYLHLALAARADVFETVLTAVTALADVADESMYDALKTVWAQDKPIFDPLSSIIACAYFMTPEVKELIGYPGQHRDPAGLEDAANELETGILDPVLERGYIYVSAAGE
ncbi:hypothetical protein TUM20983_38060 [Mycobacterium antarcticum]|uniref:hypothetical protein n=1 Tax=Mycolicibacterium sp. TUM20983 TaxID=3023369 RepID=UPI002399E2CE|nr:hypothetical protein [Mycolicibacterium sp. TUM20983]GLP76696.1 hypothetical protein TUM20983_38060 [Mycolicibacterium sp. TUM20983]